MNNAQPSPMVDPNYYGADDAAPFPGAFAHYSRNAISADAIWGYAECKSCGRVFPVDADDDACDCSAPEAPASDEAALEAAMALPAPMPSPVACATLAKHAVMIARELTAMDRYDRDALAVTVESELREIAADGVFAAYPDFVRNVAHGAAMMAPTVK